VNTPSREKSVPEEALFSELAHLLHQVHARVLETFFNNNFYESYSRLQNKVRDILRSCSSSVRSRFPRSRRWSWTSPKSSSGTTICTRTPSLSTTTLAPCPSPSTCSSASLLSTTPARRPSPSPLPRRRSPGPT
jgi:hypothetical protein